MRTTSTLGLGLLLLGCAPGPLEPVPVPSFVERPLAGADSPVTRHGALAVTAFDADGDGDLDLLVPGGFGFYVGSPRGLTLLVNDGAGAFAERTPAETGLDVPRLYSTALAFDADGDGDLDVYAAALESSAFYDAKAPAGAPGVRSADGHDVLYRNDGAGRFTDVTAAAGIAADGNTFGAAASDVDRDGDLDLYVSEYVDADLLDAAVAFDGRGPAERDHLFINRGDGTFADETLARGLGGPGDRLGYAPLFLDVDGDGDDDLVVPQDFGAILLYVNDGRGHFEDRSADVAAPLGTWMGCAPLDFDADGDFDLACDNSGTSALANPLVAVAFPPGAADVSPYSAHLENLGGGRFADVARSVEVAGLQPLPINVPRDAFRPPVNLERMPWGWGLTAGDVDADGHEDLYQTGSFAVTSLLVVGTAERGAHPGVLLRREPGRGLTDVTRAAGIENVDAEGAMLPAWGNLLVDLTGDGFLDVVVANHHTAWRDAGVRWFAHPGSRHHRLTVVLVGRTNRHAVGAVVELVRPDGTTQRRVVSSGGWGVAPGPLHFGLGDDPAVDHLVVRWPSGLRQRVDAPVAGEPHRRLVVVEP